MTKKTYYSACYFLVNSFFRTGIGPIIGFLPTIAKQLGYSITTYGVAMTFISMIKMVMSPLAGIIVDTFRVKKTSFFTMTVLLVMISIVFMFVPKVPLEIGVDMKCESEITLIVHTDTVQRSTHNTSMFNDENNDELIACKVRLNIIIKILKCVWTWNSFR